VHTCASLLDTTVPDAQTPNECPEKSFVFETWQLVKNYWFTLQWISLNTPAGIAGL